MARTKLKLKSIASGTIPGRIKIANENITAGSVDSDAMGAGAITGPKLSAFAQRGGGNKNFAHNGAMRVAQRGTQTSQGNAEALTAVDRWKIMGANTAGRLSTIQQAVTDLPGFTKCLRLDCTTADTSIAANEYMLLEQRFEGQDLQTLLYNTASAKTLTFSFYVKGNAAATYSFTWQYQPAGGVARWYTKSVPVTTSWNRVSITVPGDTDDGADHGIDDDNVGRANAIFWLHGGTNFSSGTHVDGGWADRDYTKTLAEGATSFFDSTDRLFEITGFQVEFGPVATEFEHEPFDKTFNKCLRYYQKTYDYARAPGYSASSTSSHTRMFLNNRNPGHGHAYGQFQKRMRAAPTITHYNPYDGSVNEMSNYDGTAGDNSGSNISRIGEEGYTAYTNSTSLGHFIAWHFTADSEL